MSKLQLSMLCMVQGLFLWLRGLTREEVRCKVLCIVDIQFDFWYCCCYLLSVCHIWSIYHI